MSQSGHDKGARTSDARAEPALSFESDDEKLDFAWIDIPGLVFFWGLAIVVFLQFFTRYVLNDSLAWTEEIARYILILVAFGGAMTVVRKGTSIFLEFFYRYIPPLIGKWLSVGVEVMTTAFYGYLIWLGVDLSLKTKTKMASAPIPKSIVYWSVTAFLVVMVIFSAIWVIRKIRQSPADVIKTIEEQSMTTD